MRMIYRVESFEDSAGTWHFFKIVEGKCTAGVKVTEQLKAREIFKKMYEGYDPTDDKRRRQIEDPEKAYRQILLKTKDGTAKQGIYLEKSKRTKR